MWQVFQEGARIEQSSGREGGEDKAERWAMVYYSGEQQRALLGSSVHQMAIERDIRMLSQLGSGIWEAIGGHQNV